MNMKHITLILAVWILFIVVECSEEAPIKINYITKSESNTIDSIGNDTTFNIVCTIERVYYFEILTGSTITWLDTTCTIELFKM